MWLLRFPRKLRWRPDWTGLQAGYQDLHHAGDRRQSCRFGGQGSQTQGGGNQLGQFVSIGLNSPLLRGWQRRCTLCKSPGVMWV